MTAYYNEIDPFAAEWLRNLIKEGHIAPGIVDERSIEDVLPSDLKEFTQCHFFAGIGVWSHALRGAGWSDDRQVWTGSCPCQPFSTAGKGTRFADERHLWPAFHWLIQQCQPAIVFGEQVASKDGLAWLDLVSSDMEATGYAFGAADLCAAGFGAPHIRQRSFWVAYADDTGLEGWRQSECKRAAEWVTGAGLLAGGMADTDSERREVEVFHYAGGRKEDRQREAGFARVRYFSNDASLPTNGIWRDADWLGCRDGKWRPVIACPQPLADGSSPSLGRVRDADRKACEEEIIAWAMGAKIDLPSAMRDLWGRYAEEAQSCWTAGRFPRLCEAPFLLAFLRQLAVQGWTIAKSCALSCEETAAIGMRVLRDEGTVTSPSCQSGLAEQRTGEPSDTLHILSSILARHACQAWEKSHRAYAETQHPLTTESTNRVGRLRGYGNAIVAPVAQGFIEVVMENLK